MPHRLAPLLLVLWLLAGTGCTSAGAWRYAPASKPLAAEPLTSLRVAVLPFTDERGDENSDAALAYLVPLVPFGPFLYQRPESAASYVAHSSYQVRPTEDLAKAVVAELRAANLFQEVFYTEREREPGVDAVIHGRLVEFSHAGGILGYGVSVLAPVLWAATLPAGYATNRMEVALELRSPDGERLWRSDPFAEERSRTIDLYNSWSAEFEGYPELTREASALWVEGLAERLRSIEAEQRAREAASAISESDPRGAFEGSEDELEEEWDGWGWESPRTSAPQTPAPPAPAPESPIRPEPTEDGSRDPSSIRP